MIGPIDDLLNKPEEVVLGVDLPLPLPALRGDVGVFGVAWNIFVSVIGFGSSLKM